MKRKYLSNKLQPLICKKGSKKRKIIIYEYENNISNLMRKLKIEDNADESSSSDENTPPDIRALESSVRNKLLRCNLKTYSSYSSSKNINVYKKAESKCIRFISIGTYLQGKVFSTPHSSTLAIRRFSPYYGIKNKSTVTSPKPLLTDVTNALGLNKMESHLTLGKFSSVLNFNLKFADVFKRILLDSAERLMGGNEFTLSVRKLQNFSLIEQFRGLAPPMPFTSNFLNRGKIVRHERSSSNSSSRELVPCSSIHFSHHNFGQDFKPVETGVGNISNQFTEEEKYGKETVNRNMDRIKQTIMELMLLGLEIENYVSVLSTFNQASASVHDTGKLKKKFADLVVEYKYLQAKEYKINNKQYIQNDFSMPMDSTCDNYEENESLNACQASVNIPDIPVLRKRKCKRQKRDKEENGHVLKRSKMLDECILRAKSVENFNMNREKFSSSNLDDINNIQHGDTNLDEGKMFDVISDSNSLAESPPVDIPIGEIHQTPLKLPSFHETFKDIQKTDREYPDTGNVSNTIYYDIDDGRKLVILPYINIY